MKYVNKFLAGLILSVSTLVVSAATIPTNTTTSGHDWNGEPLSSVQSDKLLTEALAAYVLFLKEQK
jgi:hypothetical protein